MQDLRVIGVENGALLVSSVDGTRYRIPIDEVLQSRLRQAVPDPGSGRKLAPREIQAQIRSGMSAQDVAAVTGVPLEYIQKFEGPVLAEREFVVETALGVAVHTANEPDPMSIGRTFGIVIRERLVGLGAVNERWASWKDAETGWIVKLAFTADQIDHDARWSFDPKRLTLAPLNNEAITLSQQGEAASTLVPRLRAVNGDDREADNSRFDSGAFDIDDESLAHDHAPLSQGQQASRFASTAPVEQTQDHNQTADLLEALRRRRGEREAASFGEDEPSAHPSRSPNATGGIRLVDVPLGDFLTDDADDDGRATAPQPVIPTKSTARKGRTAMPSWDDIVFGARPDDDLT
ncbi:hypothetical protein HD599_001586 [Conyzicola lurida]|uniref:DUF3071 domain-containing protein n=1 Tax=Conyzicola lurida TaxID=1172621 RepID=A0A841ANS9_9MICO|nr:septation protein SepH [Conyzicola lurida]MBB5843263.1 hypothetical protein [Conyzicola lurida]